jgi:hypothetical protein
MNMLTLWLIFGTVMAISWTVAETKLLPSAQSTPSTVLFLAGFGLMMMLVVVGQVVTGISKQDSAVIADSLRRIQTIKLIEQAYHDGLLAARTDAEQNVNEELNEEL